MKSIITLPGVELSDARSLPVVSRTEEGKAIGGVPGWKMLLDPKYPAGTGLRNRTQPKSIMNGATAAWDASNFGVFPNGQIAAIPPATTPKRLIANVAMNPTAWTFFIVMSAVLSSPGQAADMMRPEDTNATGYGPRVSLTASGVFNVYGSATGLLRASVPGAFPTAAPHLMMVTFSTRDGLRVYRDGVLAADATADKQALNEHFSAGEYCLLRVAPAGFDIKAGYVGILDIDLGWAEYGGYRRAIEAFLKSKYGIA